MEARTETREAERDDIPDSEDALQETPNTTEPQAIVEPPRFIPRRNNVNKTAKKTTVASNVHHEYDGQNRCNWKTVRK